MNYIDAYSTVMMKIKLKWLDPLLSLVLLECW